MSCIKSIQRGTASGPQTITINEVDPNKCLVLVNGNGVYSNTYYYNSRAASMPYLSSMTTTSITISEGPGTVETNPNNTGYPQNRHDVMEYSWQVIEFA